MSLVKVTCAGISRIHKWDCSKKRGIIYEGQLLQGEFVGEGMRVVWFSNKSRQLSCQEKCWKRVAGHSGMLGMNDG